MSLYTKKFVAKPNAVKEPPPPRTAADDKRTFDMRPKPSDDNRRYGPRDRPVQHIDPINADPLDPDPGE